MAVEKTWDERILELVPSGVDVTLLEERLRLTPTERLERLQAMLDFAEDVRDANAISRALRGALPRRR